MAGESFNLPSSQVAVQITAGSDPVSTVQTNQTAEVPQFPSSGTNTLVRVSWASPDPIDYKLLAMPWPIPRLALGAGPVIPAQAFVGRVWKTTDARFKAGDLVWGRVPPSKFGSLAGYTLVKGELGINKVPDSFTRGFEEFAAAAVVALTAFQTLKAGDLPYNTTGRSSQGGNVFINGGSGGVGTFTVQMAKHGFGVNRVIASCSSANVDLVKSLGADEVVDYRTVGKEGVSGWLKDWSKRTGEQFDLIIDNVGSDPALYWESHHYLKQGKGEYVQVGGGLDFGSLLTTAKKTLLPSFLGGGKRRFQFLGVASNNEDYSVISQWMADGKVKAVIEEENKMTFNDAKKAYEKLQTGRTRGKIVIDVGATGQ